MLVIDHTRLELTEPRHPPVVRADFADVMARMAATVSVVTASHEGKSLGRTVTATLSLGVTPPSVMVSIDIASPLADLIVRANGFSMAMLSDDQQIIADAFAGKLGDIDRFMMGVWGNWPSGHPLLYGAAAAIDCELIGTIETKTHLLFAGAILHTDVAGKHEPLLWHDRGYRRVERT